MSAITSNVTVKLEDGVSGPARAMGSSMTQLEQKSTQSFGAMTRAGRQAEGQMKRTAAEMNATKLSSISMATSITGLGASFVALETTMSNIPKRLNAISRAEVALKRVQDTIKLKNISLRKQEIALQKARESGKKTVAELAVLEDKIGATRQQLTTYTDDAIEKQKDLNVKQGDYADTLKLMTTSIFTTFLTAATSVVIMMSTAATAADMTTGAFIRAKGAIIVNSRVLRLLGIDLKAASLAFRGFHVQLNATGAPSLVAVHGIRRVGLAFKGLYAAMGPLGWAVIGLTTAYEIFAFNVGGAGDALRWLTDEIIKIVPWLEGLKHLVEWMFPPTEELAESTEELAAAEEEAAAEAERMAAGMESAGAAAVKMNEAVVGLGSSVGTMANTVAKMWDIWRGDAEADINERLNLIVANLDYLREKGIQPMSKEWQLMTAIVLPEIQRFGDEIREGLGPEALAPLTEAVQAFGWEAASTFEEVGQAATGSLTGFRGELAKTTEMLEIMWDIHEGRGEEDLRDRIEAVTGALTKMKEDGIDPASPAFRIMVKRSLPEIQKLGDEIYEILGPEAFAEYERVVKDFGHEFAYTMNGAVAAARGLGDEMDRVKKKSMTAGGRYEKLYGPAGSEAIYKAQQNREIIGFRGDTITVTGFDAKGNRIVRQFRSRIFAPSAQTYGGFAREAIRQFSAGIDLNKLAGLGRALPGGGRSYGTGNRVGPTRAGLTRAPGRRKGGHNPDPDGFIWAQQRMGLLDRRWRRPINRDMIGRAALGELQAARRRIYLNVSGVGTGNYKMGHLYDAADVLKERMSAARDLWRSAAPGASDFATMGKIPYVGNYWERLRYFGQDTGPGSDWHATRRVHSFGAPSLGRIERVLDELVKWREKIESKLGLSFDEQSKIEQAEGQGRWDIVNMVNRHERLSMAALGA